MSARIKEPISTPGESQQSKATSERNAQGQYVRGNRGGPGNPFNRQMAAFRKMMVETATEDDVSEVTKALIGKAREGEMAAIKLFLLYMVGKPLPAVDPDRVDVDEWKLCEESNVGGAAGEAVLIDGMPVRLATRFAAVMEVSKVEKMKKQLKEDELRFAEEARIDAAEQAAIDRGIEESIRQHREKQAGKPTPPAERPKTLEELLGITTEEANGLTRGYGPPTFDAIPTANEIDQAEQRAIDAAEDAAIQRGIEESLRAHREAVARGEVKPAPRQKTFEEIMGMPAPLPFGANGGMGAAGRASSPLRNGANGGERPSPNGDFGGEGAATSGNDARTNLAVV